MITPRTKITLSLATIAALVFAGWNARSWFEDFRSEQRDAFAKLSREAGDNRREFLVRADTNAAGIAALARSQVSREALLIWSYEMERENRALQRLDGKTGLIVPTPLIK